MDCTQPFEFGDLTFIVDDRRMYVNKATLAMSSEVFMAMFTSEFREKKMTEIPLPGKKFDDFLQLMQILHPPHRLCINGTNVESLLSLAHEYLTLHVTENCEKYLLTQPSSIHNLMLADRYSLTKLHKACIEFTNNIPLETLDMDQDFQSLHSESLAEVYRRKLELGGEISKQVICNLMSQPPSIKNLLLAEKHNLPEAYEKCMKYLKDTPLSKVKTEPGFAELKAITLNKVLVHKFATLVTEMANIISWGRFGQLEGCSNTRSDHCKGSERDCPICKMARFDEICRIMKKY